MRPLEAVISGMMFIAIVAAAVWAPVWVRALFGWIG
jgi:hypothetical protein